MNRKNARMAIALVMLVSSAMAGCLQSKPKTLGKTKPNFGRSDTADSNSFKFNFAYRDTAAAAPLDKIIYIQGSANSKTAVMSTCNSAGTNCVCEFLDSTGTELEETDVVTNEISYDQTGNYLRCEFDGVLANLASVRVRNQNSTVVSTTLTVDTSLTVQKLIGPDLDVNLVRSIYRYVCLHNYLEKDGTSTTSFDCSSQASLCSDGVGANGDFCLLQSNFPYFVYSDNYSTNLSQKPADLLYNQGNDNSICGLQIKKYDCAGGAGTPSRQFGLYAQQAGIFETAIQLSVGPDISASTYGFAAKTSTFMGNTVCPPGMERRVFKQATTSTAGMMSTNYPNGEIIKDITDPTAALGSVAVVELDGGDCNGTTCSPVPFEVHNSPPAAFAYSIPVSNVEFCVIKDSILP